MTKRLFLTLAFAAMQPLLAGPPLICHPIEIGTARSLPWSAAKGWNGVEWIRGTTTVPS